MINQSQCPLCQHSRLSRVHRHEQAPITGREYWLCLNCQMIHVPEQWQWGPAQEKSVYDQHQNEFGDKGYERFLRRLLTPLSEHLTTNTKGIDFGCGPSPVLAKLLTEDGYPCTIYDLYYYPDPAPLNTTYDYVVSTEVVEHLANPRAVFERLVTMLKPRGLLALMTQTWHDLESFRRWHYINDPTHISLFHMETFRWMAGNFSLRLIHANQGVFIFQHQPENSLTTQ